uniref:Uncharacterized protein n=1 Tax=Cacopsylla melanoneura TaxID=428564 RepID=A0A8D8X986_9HEMI
MTYEGFRLLLVGNLPFLGIISLYSGITCGISCMFSHSNDCFLFITSERTYFPQFGIFACCGIFFSVVYIKFLICKSRYLELDVQFFVKSVKFRQSFRCLVAFPYKWGTTIHFCQKTISELVKIKLIFTKFNHTISEHCLRELGIFFLSCYHDIMKSTHMLYNFTIRQRVKSYFRASKHLANDFIMS